MPTNVEMYDAAIELQQAGKVDEAIEKLNELVAQDGQYALAHAALSVFYSRKEEHDQAIEHGRKVCELEPNDPFSFTALSSICQKAGRIPEAEEALMKARDVQIAAAQHGTSS